LFIAYALAMKGRQMLRWSQGLKEEVGVTDISDEEAAEHSVEAADVLGLLTGEQWRFIRRVGCRAQVLDAAELGGWPAVCAYLARLVDSG
jgi:hypothetical protein